MKRKVETNARWCTTTLSVVPVGHTSPFFCLHSDHDIETLGGRSIQWTLVYPVSISRRARSSRRDVQSILYRCYCHYRRRRRRRRRRRHRHCHFAPPSFHRHLHRRSHRHRRRHYYHHHQRRHLHSFLYFTFPSRSCPSPPAISVSEKTHHRGSDNYLFVASRCSRHTLVTVI